MNSNQNNIELIKAEVSDSDDILSWRNDETTRENSINTEIVTKSEHEKWFNEKLSSEKSDIYIGVLNETKIGLIRIDYEDEGSAEISINLNPEERGKGYGSKLLSKGVERGFNKYETLTARIKKSNFISIKIFESVGFIKEREVDDILFYKILR